MMDREYLAIANEIINDEKYQKLKDEKHHGITRYEHSIRVAKKTYIMTKKRNLDYKKATRAALLHDFFYSYQTAPNAPKRMCKHPYVAYYNANEMIELSSKENNIIVSHMFPLTREYPKSREAWVVTYVDKIVALKEFIKYKFNIKKLLLNQTK